MTDAPPNSATPLLMQQDKGLFLQFSGQGNSFLLELRKLHRTFPGLGDFLETCAEAIDEALARDEVAGSPYFSQGFSLREWLRKENVPSNQYLNRAVISLPATEITQLAYYHTLLDQGYNEAELIGKLNGITGHSQGVLAAVFVALGLKGSERRQALKRHIQFLMLGGLRCQQTFPHLEVPEALSQQSIELDGEPPTPMTSISGITRTDLQAELDAFNQSIPPERKITIALYNTPDSMILSGFQEDLVTLRTQTKASFEGRGAKWNYLEISAPFHSHIMPGALDAFRGDLEWMGYSYKGSDLKVPVYSTHDGHNLQNRDEDLGEFLFLLQSSESLDWEVCTKPMMADQNLGAVIDCGPGRVSAAFTADLLKRAGRQDVEMVTMAAKTGLARALATK